MGGLPVPFLGCTVEAFFIDNREKALSRRRWRRLDIIESP